MTEPHRSRVLVLIAGVACMALGALVGWVAALQGSDGKSNPAVAQAATASEGWANVARGAYALAKSENAAAQAARRQAVELAAKAEKAAARADAAAARAAKDRLAVESFRAAPPVAVTATAPPVPRVLARLAALVPLRAEGCRRAAIFERTAADRATSHHAAYNAVMAGVAMNAHCPEPEHSLNEAYLLAQRAAAERSLNVGNWKADLLRSDELLAQCVKRPEYRGATSSACRTRLKKNDRIRQTALR